MTVLMDEDSGITNGARLQALRRAGLMFSAMVSIGRAASWSVAARGTIMAGLGAGELPPWRCVHHTLFFSF